MGLLIRMIMYGVSAFLTGFGFATFDSGSGVLHIDVDQIATLISGGSVFVGTFFISRIVKKSGGKT